MDGENTESNGLQPQEPKVIKNPEEKKSQTKKTKKRSKKVEVYPYSELLKVHNDLTDVSLKTMSAGEIDLFYEILSEIKDHRENQLSLSFDHIKKRVNYKNKNEAKLIEDLLNTNKKLLSFNIMVTHEGIIHQLNMFETFITDPKDKILTVKVNKDFLYLINNVVENYTTVEIFELFALNSRYSKLIYRQLRRYRNSPYPFWTITIEDFRECLGIPESFEMCHIDSRIIEPAIDELKQFFPRLRVEKIRKRITSGQGNSTVVGLTFKWNAQVKSIESKPMQEQNQKSSNDSNNPADDMQDKIPVTSYKDIGKICPICKRKIYEKEIKNESDSFLIYGHKDWKTGPCNFSTKYYTELLVDNSIPTLEPVKSEVKTEIKAENKTETKIDGNVAVKTTIDEDDPDTRKKREEDKKSKYELVEEYRAKNPNSELSDFEIIKKVVEGKYNIGEI